MSKKMKDVFKLPLKEVDDGHFPEGWGRETRGNFYYTKKEHDAIVHAVNSHDELVEQKRVAVEALKDIKKHQQIVAGGLSVVSSVMMIVDKALSSIDSIEEKK